MSKNKKLWGGRFKGALLPELEVFSSSLDVDWQLFQFDIAGSIAHARGLAAAGIINTSQLRAIERGLKRIYREIDSDEFAFAFGDEDIHTAIERRLTELTPHGAALHAGRSRNDQVALDMRLYCRSMTYTILLELALPIAALADAAEAHAAWPMPGYTHLQRAQPVTVGHHLLAHAEPLLRDAERFRNAWRAAGEMPLGSAALAASTLPLQRRLVARELGFSRLTANSIDAVADRDFALDLVYACLVTNLHLSRLGEDIVLWASSEFGFVRLRDEIATGSSLMPQKKNPDIAELLRGRAGRALASLTALATVLKGLPLAYDRDLQEDKPAVIAAVRNTLDCLSAAALLVRNLEFDKDRVELAASDVTLLATDAAERLVRSGTPFRKAHQTVGRAVRDGKFAAAGDVRTSLAQRDLPGGPAPSRVRARARAVRREALRLREWVKKQATPLPL